MSEREFVDLLPDKLGVPIDAWVGRRVLELRFEDGSEVRFVKRGLTQFLHQVGLRKRDLRRLSPRDIIDRWYELGLNTVLSAFTDQGKYIVYRVTSDAYVPIPHRVLFTHVDEVLRSAGINTTYKVERWFNRTAARWLLWSNPLRYLRKGDALNIYLRVSNANTGVDSIRVTGYGEILACANGLTTERGQSIKVIHVRELQGVLSRVTDAVKAVLARLAESQHLWVDAIERLQHVTLSKEEMNRWMNDLLMILPKKYQPYLYKQLHENEALFGEGNAEALFQAVTWLVPRVKNQALHERLDKVAREMLAVAK
jgi:hypothetical protein